MRNPNYKYQDANDGWMIIHDDPVSGDSTSTWGKTKAAARSRLLRMLKHNDKIAFENQVKQEKVNDQS